MILSGNESILYIKWAGDYIPVGCLTDNGMDEETELLPTTTQQTNGWRTFRANLQSYSLSFSGLQVFSIPVEVPILSYDRLQIIKRNRTLVQWRELRGNDLVQEGRGIIVSLSGTNPVNTDGEFSGTIQGYGSPKLFLEETLLSDGLGNGVEDGLGNGIAP